MGRWRFPNNMLIEQVQMLAKEYGRAPTEQEFDKSRLTVSAEMCVRRFGSWYAYLERAGLVPKDVPDEKIIERVLLKACELGRVPTEEEFEESNEAVTLEMCYRHFGSWRQLLDAAGLKY